MKLLRRLLGALAMTVIAAAGLRLSGKGGTPPQHGGWRPLEIPPSPSPPSDHPPSDHPPSARTP